MVNLFGDNTIEMLVDTAGHVLDNTCTLYRFSDVESTYGGNSGSLVAFGTVSCHVSRAHLVTPEFRENAEQQMPDTSWLVLMPRGTSLQDHDIITWSNAYGGGTVSVVEVLPRTWEIVRRAFCRNAHDVQGL